MQVADEITFLRFFYHAAGDAFGPADSEVYDCINDEFVAATGTAVPAKYDPTADG